MYQAEVDKYFCLKKNQTLQERETILAGFDYHQLIRSNFKAPNNQVDQKSMLNEEIKDDSSEDRLR